MGVCDPDLTDVGNHLEDALDSLKRAKLAVNRILGDVDPGEDFAWPAMEQLSVQLDEIERQLTALPGPELAKAIEAERAYQDEMSDRQDGLSY